MNQLKLVVADLFSPFTKRNETLHDFLTTLATQASTDWRVANCHPCQKLSLRLILFLEQEVTRDTLTHLAEEGSQKKDFHARKVVPNSCAFLPHCLVQKELISQKRVDKDN